MFKDFKAAYFIAVPCLLVVFVLSGCEKDITLDLETPPEKLVVEGHIEPGFPPYVILTHNVPYFELTNIEDLENIFVHDAEVTVDNGTQTYVLTEYCSQSVPDSLLAVASLYLGVDIDDLVNHDFCIYTTALDTGKLFTALLGELGRTYRLRINSGSKTLMANTTLPYPVPLDSIWFVERPANDGYWSLWTTLTDPPGAGNYYRMFTQRLQKDDYMVPSKQSLLADDKINGTTVDLLFDRGNIPGRSDDHSGYYHTGDTVVVKWCSLDYGHYEFWRTAQMEFDNAGNPIASSTQIKTNIEGGLGIWGAYGAIYDTLVIK